jgi:ketosteroid isomerase-like protein
MHEHPYIELARETWKRFNRHDIDALAELVDPNFEGYSANVLAEGGAPYLGIEGARAWWADLFDTFGDVQAEFEQGLVLGDHVFQVLTITYTSREEGLKLPTPVYVVNEVRDGRSRYARTFFDPAEALTELAQRLRGQ